MEDSFRLENSSKVRLEDSADNLINNKTPTTSNPQQQAMHDFTRSIYDANRKNVLSEPQTQRKLR